MKIHKVRLAGFGPYPGTETVDFDAFADDGLFVITGKTGAGKTTILDAVTFALFGDVPRYGNVTDDSVRSKYLVDSVDETRVDVEFSQGELRYRVSRIPSYTKPGNKNPRAQWAEIAEITDDGERVIESRQVRKVAERIDEIVGLNAAQFKQVILLAQGEFQRFLVADSQTRRELLRKLFDTGRFLDYSNDLDSQARKLRIELEHTVTTITAHLHSLGDEMNQELPEGMDGSQPTTVLQWAEELSAAQRAEMTEAIGLTAKAKKELEGAHAALSHAKATSDNQLRRDRAVARQQTLAAREPEIAQAVQKLEAAQRAHLVQPVMENTGEATAALAESKLAHAAAVQRFRRLLPGLDADLAVARFQVNRLVGEVAKLGQAAEREAGLAALIQADEAARAAVERSRVVHAAHTTELGKLKDSEPVLVSRIGAAVEAADDFAAADKLAGTLQTQLAAAQAAESIGAQWEQSLAEELSARKIADQAQADVTALKQRQYEEYAGKLAQSLDDGVPCQVCGSVSHPAPAALAVGHVTEDEVAAAEITADAAQQQVRQAAELVVVLKTRLESERAIAQGRSVTDLVAQLDTATARVAAARAAGLRVEELTAERAGLADRIAAEVDEADRAKDAMARAETQAAVTLAALESEIEQIAEARGEFETVADRLARMESELSACEKLVDASADLAYATELAGRAQDKLATVLVEQEFGSPEEAEAAFVPRALREEMQCQVAEHERDAALVHQTLADAAIKELPGDPIDLIGPQELLQRAEDAHTLAVRHETELSKTLGSIERLAGQIRSALEAAGGMQTEYDLVQRLAETIKGQGPNTKRMSLETFALAADLEEIVRAANVLLGRMSNGRYELRYSDEVTKGMGQSGLAVEVNDAYNEELRSPQSLSGGEKFQASLALALGLAEVVTSRNGGARLDTLFIDEGFGTLDEETLSEVLDTIDDLREGGRTVGLISHVGHVKERIPNHLGVQVTAGGWSTLVH